MSNIFPNCRNIIKRKYYENDNHLEKNQFHQFILQLKKNPEELEKKCREAKALVDQIRQKRLELSGASEDLRASISTEAFEDTLIIERINNIIKNLSPSQLSINSSERSKERKSYKEQARGYIRNDKNLENTMQNKIFFEENENRMNQQEPIKSPILISRHQAKHEKDLMNMKINRGFEKAWRPKEMADKLEILKLSVDFSEKENDLKMKKDLAENKTLTLFKDRTRKKLFLKRKQEEQTMENEVFTKNKQVEKGIFSMNRYEKLAERIKKIRLNEENKSQNNWIGKGHFGERNNSLDFQMSNNVNSLSNIISTLNNTEGRVNKQHEKDKRIMSEASTDDCCQQQAAASIFGCQTQCFTNHWCQPPNLPQPQCGCYCPPPCTSQCRCSCSQPSQCIFCSPEPCDCCSPSEESTTVQSVPLCTCNCYHSPEPTEPHCCLGFLCSSKKNNKCTCKKTKHKKIENNKKHDCRCGSMCSDSDEDDSSLCQSSGSSECSDKKENLKKKYKKFAKKCTPKHTQIRNKQVLKDSNNFLDNFYSNRTFMHGIQDQNVAYYPKSLPSPEYPYLSPLHPLSHFSASPSPPSYFHTHHSDPTHFPVPPLLSQYSSAIPHISYRPPQSITCPPQSVSPPSYSSLESSHDEYLNLNFSSRPHVSNNIRQQIHPDYKIPANELSAKLSNYRTHYE